MHSFSMQVVINKCFLLNPEKIFGADPFCHFREKRKKRTSNSENDVTEPKARRLAYSNNQFRHLEIMVSESLETNFLLVNSLTGY